MLALAALLLAAADPAPFRSDRCTKRHHSRTLHSIDAPLDRDLIYSIGTLKTTSSVMQSFDFDFENGLIYYSQLNKKYRLYIPWGPVDGTAPTGCMELHYFGHGSNFSVESKGDDRYIWIGNYASKNAKGEYWDSQIVSRVPIEDGAVVKPWDAQENFYFGEKNVTPAVDIANDRISILGITSGLMRTYRLSDLLALPVETVTLSPITYGGDKAPDPETTAVLRVEARDCRRVEPIASFTIPRTKGISWQGFDIHGDRIYQAQGNGNANDGRKASTCYLLVFGIDGKVIMPRTGIASTCDIAALDSLGITDTGYMEPEGVKIRNGVMYCGYASKDSGDIRRGVIFRFSPQPPRR